jgi:hypothetical protein
MLSKKLKEYQAHRGGCQKVSATSCTGGQMYWFRGALNAAGLLKKAVLLGSTDITAQQEHTQKGEQRSGLLCVLLKGTCTSSCASPWPASVHRSTQGAPAQTSIQMLKKKVSTFTP